MECEPLGVFEDLLKKKGVEFDYTRQYQEEAPSNLNEYDGLIVLGGLMGAYQEEKYPFLRDGIRLIQEAVKSEKPVLGVCLGSQLMARALGARVYKGHGTEIGWHKVRLTGEGKEDPIFKGFEHEFMALQWHGDTFDLPDGATRLASSDIYPNQAFRIGNSYAMQFHLEVTKEMVQEWLDEYCEEVESLKGTVDPKDILEDTDKYVKGLNSLAEKFIEGFL